MTDTTTKSLDLTEADILDAQDGSFVIRLDEKLGRPGMPWSFGTLRLERNPRLAPIKARGFGSQPGHYHSLRNNDKVHTAISRIAATLAASTWRLEKPELPEWMADDAAAQIALDAQWEYCSRVWRQWTAALPNKPSRLSAWIREMFWTAPIMGFYLAEIVADEATVAFSCDGIERTVWMPKLPCWMAPWSVRYWLTQDEELVGVVCTFSQSTDRNGSGGKTHVPIPAEKLLHVAADKVGSNHEGSSWLRPVANLIDMNRDSHTTEAVAERVHGAGEVFFIGDFDGPDADRVDEYLVNRESLHAPGARLPKGTEVLYGNPSQSMPDLGDTVRRRDRAILTALGAEDRAIATEGGGSYAARETASADARDESDDRAQQYVCEPLEQVLARMIRASGLDWGSDDYCFAPSVKYGQVEQRDNAAYLDALKTASESGALRLTEEDEAVIRDMLDLPERAITEGDGDKVQFDAGTLQGLRLAYQGGLLFDPDIGPVIRKSFKLPPMTDAAYLRWKATQTPDEPMP